MLKAQTKSEHGPVYTLSLQDMTDEQLLKETKKCIWHSAFANNNPRCEFHWKADMCYDECKNRDPNLVNYKKAYNAVARQTGNDSCVDDSVEDEN